MFGPWYLTKSWKLTARTIRPNAIYLLPAEYGESLRRLEVSHWRGKVVCRSTKSAISLKRIKIAEKLLPIGTHERFSERLHPWPPTTFSSWRLCFATPTQNSNQSLLGISQERVKVRLQILYAQWRDRSEQKSIKNVGKISCRGSHAGTPKNFQSTHIGYRAYRAVIFVIARLSCISGN